MSISGLRKKFSATRAAAEQLRERLGRYPTESEISAVTGIAERTTLMVLATKNRLDMVGCKYGLGQVERFIERSGGKPNIYQISGGLGFRYARVHAIVLANNMQSLVDMTNNTNKISLSRSAAADFVRSKPALQRLSAISKAIGGSESTAYAMLKGSDVPFLEVKRVDRKASMGSALALAEREPGVHSANDLAAKFGLARQYVYNRFFLSGQSGLLRRERVRKPRHSVPEILDSQPRMQVVDILHRQTEMQVVGKTEIRPAANTFNQLLSKGW